MRHARLVIPNARYHVSARAVHKEYLLDNAKAKELFLEVVARARKKFTFRLENFCIMGNHFHFLLQPLGRSTLSEIMKWILQVFAQTFNRIFKLWGHFWGDRFHSKPVVTLRDYLSIFAYIDENPRKAGLVSTITGWPFGGLAHHLARNDRIVDRLEEWQEKLFPWHKPF